MNEVERFEISRSDIWLESIGSFPQWISDALTDSERLNGYLEQRFASCAKHAVLRDMGEFYEAYTAKSVVVWEAQRYVLEFENRISPKHYPETFYLGAPASELAVRKCFSAHGIEVDDLVLDFFKSFAGWREHYSVYGNFHSMLRPLDVLDKFFIGEMDPSESEHWKNSPSIYTSRCGDQVYLHQDGMVAWFEHLEMTFHRFAGDFSEFCEKYSYMRIAEPRHMANGYYTGTIFDAIESLDL